MLSGSKKSMNPRLGVKFPSVGKSEKRSLSCAEIDALLQATLDDWTRPFIQVALATSCRRGELLALLWTDVDFSKAKVEISKSLEKTSAGLRVKRPKDDEPRTFPLPQDAIATLRFQRETQEQHRKMFGRDFIDRGLVFCQPHGD
jgi:integrase